MIHRNINYLISTVATMGFACAQSLYYVGDEAQESLPLKWTVGSNVIYDNNIVPIGVKEEAWSVNPYLQASMTNVSPQTTIDLYARVGVIYFLTDLTNAGADDTFPQARLGFDLLHNVNSRVRLASRNSFAYEFEPDYAQGFSSPRGSDPYILWSSDNSIGYRWTARLGSYTGLTVGGLDTDNEIASRFSYELYHNMRYQLTQRTVLVAGYRYSDWSGDQQDSTNHFITGGFEHRLSPTEILTASAGVQLREVEGADNSTSPFAEAAYSAKLNTRVTVRGFARYSIEDFDTVQLVGTDLFQYADQQVLRVGINGSYALTPRLSAFGGLDYITTAFDDGNQLGGALTDSGRSENVFNASLGLRATINTALTGECAVNFTDSGSDFAQREFDRVRVSAGVNYSF